MAKQQSTSNRAVAMKGIECHRCVLWLDRLQVIRKDYEDGMPEKKQRKFAGKLD